MSVFELESVSYSYEGLPALENVSMTVRPGQHVALLGANGSGKSTLLRLLDALDFPAAGVVRFEGQELSAMRFEEDAFAFDFRRRVGLVFQNPDAQLFNATVFDEVAFGPLQLRWPREKIIAEVNRAMEEMQISDLRNRPPHRLSGGEKKRVALASVLVLDPEVVLLDEPTAALDPRSQSQIIDLLIGWGAAGSPANKTVITATHDLGLVEDLADFCFVLDRGRVVRAGIPSEVLADQEFLERTNLLHAHRHRHASGVSHSHPHTHPHRHD